MKKSEAQKEFWEKARKLNKQYLLQIDILLNIMTVKQIQKATKVLK